MRACLGYKGGAGPLDPVVHVWQAHILQRPESVLHTLQRHDQVMHLAWQDCTLALHVHLAVTGDLDLHSFNEGHSSPSNDCAHCACCFRPSGNLYLCL